MPLDGGYHQRKRRLDWLLRSIAAVFLMGAVWLLVLWIVLRYPLEH